MNWDELRQHLHASLNRDIVEIKSWGKQCSLPDQPKARILDLFPDQLLRAQTIQDRMYFFCQIDEGDIKFRGKVRVHSDGQQDFTNCELILISKNSGPVA